MAIETSAAYKAAIKADVEVSTFEAEFGFIPDGSREGSAVTVGNQHALSRASQVNDGDGDILRYATCETNRWVLNGTMDFIDDATTDQQVGWISQSMSDDDSVFQSPPPIIYEMDREYDIIGVTLFFDTVEHATNLTIYYYSAAGVLLTSAPFDNNARVAAFEYPQAGVKRILVKMNKWSKPGRMVKCCEILPGEVFVFDPKNTISFEYSEAVNPFETAIEFPQFTIEFENTSKRFDIVNPTGLMAYLRKMMGISSKLGVLSSAFEFVSTGDFFVYSWPDTPQEDSARLVCKPEMAFYTKVSYVGAAPSTMQTVAAAAGGMFALAGISNYTVHDNLKNIIVNGHIGDNVPLPNAMGQLAVAAGGYWRFERDGSYSLLPYELPAASNIVDYDNMWERPDIEQSAKITAVNVKYYVFDAQGECTEYDNVVTAGINDGSQADDICSCFIGSASRANAVGALALQYYALRLAHDVSYRGDMSIQAGDVIETENDYGSCNVFVTQHKFAWDREDKLSGSFEGVSSA